MGGGDTSDDPNTVASFRIGDSIASRQSGYEYLLEQQVDDRLEPQASGQLVWDPDYAMHGGPLAATAQVRLDVSASEARWSVGTNAYLISPAARFKFIRKLQIVARAQTQVPHCLVQWDVLEVILHFPGGGKAAYVSPCVPKVVTGGQTRRAEQAPRERPAHFIQQFTEILLHRTDVSNLQVRGLVTLRADKREPRADRLGANDLQGKVLVFTDESRE